MKRQAVLESPAADTPKPAPAPPVVDGFRARLDGVNKRAAEWYKSIGAVPMPKKLPASIANAVPTDLRAELKTIYDAQRASEAETGKFLHEKATEEWGRRRALLV